MFLHYSALPGLDACLVLHLDIDIVMNTDTQQFTIGDGALSFESGLTGAFTLCKLAIKDDSPLTQQFCVD